MAEIIYALIDSGVVTNTIVADAAFAAKIANEHQAVIEITDLIPSPSIEWKWDGENFIPPYASSPMPTDGGPWIWNAETQDWIPAE